VRYHTNEIVFYENLCNILFRQDPRDKPGKAEIVVLKNRYGPIVDVCVNFNDQCGLFSDASEID